LLHTESVPGPVRPDHPDWRTSLERRPWL
jgi:hypothetical protein